MHMHTHFPNEKNVGQGGFISPPGSTMRQSASFPPCVEGPVPLRPRSMTLDDLERLYGCTALWGRDFNLKVAISRQRCGIGPRLLIGSHTWVSIDTESNVLE